MGEILNNFEEDKIRAQNKESGRMGDAQSQLPTIAGEKAGGDFGTAISRYLGNDGDRGSLPEQQPANTDEKAFGNADRGGC